MRFTSTRNKDVFVSASEAIVKGLSDDGGLFVPESFPLLENGFTDKFRDMDYYERAAEIVGMYLTDYPRDELLSMCKAAYSNFEGEPAPVVKIREGEYVLELWHGKTCAFKDMALSLLPHLMVFAKNKLGIEQRIDIVVATSGDTGKAALEGFKDVDGTSITAFYPSEGVSDIQKMQMRTQEGKNVRVCGVNGNFDDCQSAVKRAFSDSGVAEQLKGKQRMLSSANSINFGRLVPQIVYYISAYCDLVADEEISDGDMVNFAVPTGNFGNILAAYYAKRMGLNIGRLICASNSNNVLTDFFDTGVYDTQRSFHKTVSPSMDILISSNLERLLFEISGRNCDIVRDRMEKLKTSGQYSVTEKELAAYSEVFFAEFADEDETLSFIGEYFDSNGYLLDPHSAVAGCVAEKYAAVTGDNTPTVIISTASPFKFAPDVLFALDGERMNDPFKAIKCLSEETAYEIPSNIADLRSKKVRFSDVIGADKIEQYIVQ